MIHHGDNLEILRGMRDDSVDLIATDPPYFTNCRWSGEAGEFGDSWESRDEFIATMRAVAKECRRVLKSTGTLYWQADERVSHVLRLMLENLWGLDSFVTEITWLRTRANKTGSSWPRAADTILMFGNPRIDRDAVAVPLSEESLRVNYRYTDDEHDDSYRLHNEQEHDGRRPVEPRGKYRHSELAVSCNGRAEPYQAVTLDAPAGARKYKKNSLDCPGERGQARSWRGITLKPGRHWGVPANLPAWFKKPEGYDGWDTFKKLDELDRQGLIVWPAKPGGLPRFKLYASLSRGVCPPNVWTDCTLAAGAGERVGYPTQKPVKLYERIVLASSKPGDVVLDPFCGSGTTGVAAVRHGREFIGIDKSAQAVRVAAERVNAERLPLI